MELSGGEIIGLLEQFEPAEGFVRFFLGNTKFVNKVFLALSVLRFPIE